MFRPRFKIVPLLAALALAAGAQAAPTFAEVATLLNARCVICHTGASAPNGLQLTSYDAVMAGGKNGPVVVAGAPAGSELIKRIRGERQPRMPLTGPPWLTDAEVALIEGWIKDGAKPGAALAAAAPARPAAPVTGPVNYAHIEPILLSRCVKCHVESGGKMGPPPEGYVLRSYEQTIAATDRVRVVPGNPAASELLRKVQGVSRPRMPFDGPPWLADEEIALLSRWIADGARSRDGKPAPLPVGAQVRLRGTLTAPGELDGAAFSTPGTRIDKGPRVGGAVELRGTVQADGSIRAERLRAR